MTGQVEEVEPGGRAFWEARGSNYKGPKGPEVGMFLAFRLRKHNTVVGCSGQEVSGGGGGGALRTTSLRVYHKNVSLGLFQFSSY